MASEGDPPRDSIDAPARRRVRSPLTTKVVLFSLLMSLLTVGSVVALFAQRNDAQQTSDALEAMRTLALSAAPQCAPALVFDDPVDAEVILATLGASTLIDEATLFSADGRLFAERRSDETPRTNLTVAPSATRGTSYENGLVHIREPVYSGDERVGTLVLSSSMASVRERGMENLVVIAGVAMLLVTLTTLVAVILLRTVTEPVLALARAMRGVAGGGSLGERLTLERSDEIGDLYRGYDAMKERIRAREREVVAHRAHLEAVLAALPDPVFVVDFTGRVVEVLTKDAAVLGLESVGRDGARLLDVWPTDAATVVRDAVARIEAGERVGPIEYGLAMGERTRIFEAQLAPMPASGEGGAGRVVVLSRDVTERRLLEDQLMATQKMEAVGQLAGGIAHDINNLLTPIVGYAELIQRKPERKELLSRGIETILMAAEKAKDLVHGLLVFGRRHVAELRPLDLSSELASTEAMVRAVVRESIAIRFESACDGAVVLADSNQLQRVLVNLVVNAQDAMPHGGRLAIRLDVVHFDETSARPLGPNVHAGDFAVLSVSDTGTGIPPEVATRIFEPFFTTKEVGKGTGLGLATVYGIVRDHRGFIQVHSEVGVGTTFRVHFPLSTELVGGRLDDAESEEIWRGNETVLVVEDDAPVRELVQQILVDAGYTVLLAATGAEAIELASGFRAPIDLLLTDVILPGLDGREVHARIARSRPSLAVLYMSGHAAEVLGMDGRLDPGIRMLWKPFGGDALLRALRSSLDRHRLQNARVQA